MDSVLHQTCRVKLPNYEVLGMILGSQYKAFVRALLSGSASTDCQKTRSLKILPQLETCTVSYHSNVHQVKIGKKTN